MSNHLYEAQLMKQIIRERKKYNKYRDDLGKLILIINATAIVVLFLGLIIAAITT